MRGKVCIAVVLAVSALAGCLMEPFVPATPPTVPASGLILGAECSHWKALAFWYHAPDGPEGFYRALFADLKACGVSHVFCFAADDFYLIGDTWAKEHGLVLVPGLSKVHYTQRDPADSTKPFLTGSLRARAWSQLESFKAAGYVPPALWVADDVWRDYEHDANLFRATIKQALPDCPLMTSVTTGGHQFYWFPTGVETPLRDPKPDWVAQQMFVFGTGTSLEKSMQDAETILAVCARAQEAYGIKVGIWLPSIGPDPENLPEAYSGYALPPRGSTYAVMKRAWGLGLRGPYIVFEATAGDGRGFYDRDRYSAALKTGATTAEAVFAARTHVWYEVRRFAEEIAQQHQTVDAP